MKDKEYINKLIKELKLYDALIDGVKLINNEFSFTVSCRGMGLKYYYE